MLIDITFLVLIAIAVFKGYSKGLIVAVFSLLALVIGLAAAMKLSVVAAAHLKDAMQFAARWLPVIAFILVFITVVLIVHLVAKVLEKTAALAFLGWANRLGGILLYVCLYTIIFSVILFYAEKLHLLSATAIASSTTYAFIKPWGPQVIDAMGWLLPFFKGMFEQLEHFFAGVSDKLSVI